MITNEPVAVCKVAVGCGGDVGGTAVGGTATGGTGVAGTVVGGTAVGGTVVGGIAVGNGTLVDVDNEAATVEAMAVTARTGS